MSNTAPARKGSSLRTPRTKAAPVIKPAVPRPGATPVSTIPVIPAPPIAPEPTDSPGVVDRINGFAARTRAAEERAAALERQMAEATTRATRAERGMVLVQERVTAPSVQRALGREYDSYAAEAGDKAVDFGTWVKTEAKTDPLFAPHFAQAPAPVTTTTETPAAPVTPVATPAQPAPVIAAPVPVAAPNPHGGVVPVPVQQGKVWTDADIKGMDDVTYAAHEPIIRQQAEQGLGGMKVILPQPRTRKV